MYGSRYWLQIDWFLLFPILLEVGEEKVLQNKKNSIVSFIFTEKQ